MKKQNNQIIQFYKSYISQYTSAFSTKQLQKYQIYKNYRKKLKKKIHIRMWKWWLGQLQTIFYATLTKV